MIGASGGDVARSAEGLRGVDGMDAEFSLVARIEAGVQSLLSEDWRALGDRSDKLRVDRSEDDEVRLRPAHKTLSSLELARVPPTYT